ncbi:tetraprenyl-beta-curcumene synthase family protein [Terribacillus saccharophilus]|uniref:Tetraprenyl-beta-curcumene synthase n=1 Tax=Terribacillus saccharophilus TaxID=361277 RepID=A0ABX4GZQ2_9BACI|nr:tetraprenyl-beta-curcumene synthase family protein [Terribacillus saccharophilus]PAD36167.1 tetraprenyl-beta-curcumene synthase [Terribacillus saccharophilus]PAD96782.1 tetraprenyl-beta-curcumene synthase [Terribacillus saccharophilus]PAE00358.1 tetraprenyl-beta-curcumene synthase [Terribacillus saccharophilus]
MAQQIPKSSVLLMHQVYRKIFPEVHKELELWTQRAEAIPDPELRKQALESIRTKRFHCQGGAVYSLLAGDAWKQAIKFIIAYQTISDYLDNLCDRSTSLDPEDFRLLHQSMLDALQPGEKLKDYYALRDEREDGGYLHSLVFTCQTILGKQPNLQVLQPYLLKLSGLYGDLQVHKHVAKEERIERLTNWFAQHQEEHRDLTWYEFSACSGSTLGIFCFVSYGMGMELNHQLADDIYQSYFPYMQGLHILLDYYIDQMEDEEEGDLNFCHYYRDSDEMKERLQYFIERTNESVQRLPHASFHEMVHHGLVGLYLADRKVSLLSDGKEMIKTLLKASGNKSKFFHLNIKAYNKMKEARTPIS